MSEIPLDALKAPFFNQAKGEVEEISVLDKVLCQDVLFPSYQPHPKVQPETDPYIWQNWIESLTTCETNLMWLLKLPYEKFWCQVVNNSSLQSFLDSYLKHAPRFQDSHFPDDVVELHSNVHRFVFITYIRMATHKESVRCFMTAEFYGALIYRYYLFDIPKLMDLCAIYGNETNCALLNKAVTNIFKCQPSYNEDLSHSTETIMQIFHNINESCGVSYENEDDGENRRRPHRLSEGPQSIIGKLIRKPLPEFQDVLMYAADICFTLQRFLVDVYPAAGQGFVKVVKYLARFYSTTLSILRDAIRERQFEDLHLRSKLLAYLRIAKSSILSVVRSIINVSLLAPALRANEVGDQERVEKYSDEYFNLLSDFIEISGFFRDFMRKNPILEDVQSLIQSTQSIDETRAAFILGALGTGKSSHHEQLNHPTVNGQVTNIQGHKAAEKRVKESMSSVHRESSSIKDPEIVSLISMVHDVFPDLEEDYVRACLTYYGNNYEVTIHALLEGNVPKDLTIETPSNSSTDKHPEMHKIERQSPDAVDVAEGSSIQERRNVFDNDEFDIFKNREVDMSRVHKGKKTKKSNKDENPANEFRHIYEKYSMVSDEEEVTADMVSMSIAQCDTYDDEYDDAYDGLGVDANDGDDTDDILNRRPFVTPRVFLQKKKEVVDYNDGSSEEEQKNNRPKPDHFIANPADLRAKQEARRRQQEVSRRHKGGDGRTQQRDNSEKSTAQQRKRKDANKAKIANHNRKFMATKKASKGMGPV